MAGEDVESIRFLLTGYVKEFAAALGAQDFAAEMLELPERYAPPEGRMFVVRWEGIVVGCAAWKRFDGTRCELKRMVVAPEARGVGAGRALAVAAMQDAASHGMTEMLLDTVPEMDAARRLYASLGFEPCAAYCDSPLREPVFMRRSLENLPGPAPPRAPWPGAKARRPVRP
jgi:carbonic anhydrase